MMKNIHILLACALLASCTAHRDLPRAEASPELASAYQTFKDSVAASLLNPTDWNAWVNLHSIMVVKDGKVVIEEWFRDQSADKPHMMYSVSKTFTATAIGIAVAEGKLSLDEKVASFFPDNVVEDNPCEATVKDLLTMTGGHETDPTLLVADMDVKAMKLTLHNGVDIASFFFSHPFTQAPGEFFWYDSLCSYMLSAILQKVTGESVLDYLTPRLFEPLGIDKPTWETDSEGVCLGGWGLYLKTEDMAKMGQLLLQKGKWGMRQIVPASWVEDMGTPHIESAPAQIRIEDADLELPAAQNDWRQGYGYQVWMNTHEGFRADGALGQMILILPSKNAVVVTTAQLSNQQREMDFVWKYLYPYL